MKHILVIAHRTAATPKLLDAVQQRAQQDACRFTLLVPRPYWDPDTEEAEMTVELAVPVLERAVGGHVDAEIGDTDPAAAVRAYLADHEVDEIIVSTLPQRISRWLRRDVPSQLEGVGLPVTVIIAEQSDRTVIT